MSRPACRMAWIASMLPRLTRSTTCCAVLDLDPGLAECPGNGWSGCHGFQASAVAAVAGNAGTARNLHVPDVAGDALGAALQEAAGDDAGPDSGGDLHEDQVLGLRPGEGAFAERHDVHVVVDEHGHLQVLLHPAGHVEAVPAGHDGRVDGLPAACCTGPGRPMPIAMRSRWSRSMPSRSRARIRPSSRAPSPALRKCRWGR
jgi:hypothetical protein